MLQRNVSKWEYDACDMSVDLPRSNSAPDLRILLNSFSNSLPLAPLEKLPVMGSGIATGAIVPYKAPQVGILSTPFDLQETSYPRLLVVQGSAQTLASQATLI